MGVEPDRPAGFLKTYQFVAVFITLVVLALSIAGFTWAQDEVTLIIDGEPRQIETQAETVGVLLEQAGVDLSCSHLVTPSQDSPVSEGMTIVVREATPVSISMDDERVEIDVVGATVIEALVAAGIQPGDDLRVIPALTTTLTAGLDITVSEVVTRVVEEPVALPYEQVERADCALPICQTEVVTEGVPGEVVRTYHVVMVDGEFSEKRFVAERVVRQPVDEVVERGTRPRVAPASFTRTSSSSSRSAEGDRLTVTATAYAPGVNGVGTRTATGARAQRGIIAVDPRVIPLGTRLYVPGYGYGIAADTGGAIKGNKIDLCFDTEAEAIAWGRRTTSIIILQ
ncbi:MAG: 3D domain-containing protein [Actinobacteria bacterium]|nr:3D domain-containing protein [Actinomycetota bacterium]